MLSQKQILRVAIISTALGLAFTVAAFGQSNVGAQGYYRGSPVGSTGAFTGQMLGPDGTDALPTYSFTNSPNTGWRLNGTGVNAQLRAVVNGAVAGQIDSGGGWGAVTYYLGSTASSPDLAIRRNAASQMNLTNLANTAGVGLDFVNDGELWIRNRAHSAYANLTANNVSFTNALIGPGTVATAGSIRLANSAFITARNTANSANVQLLSLDASDYVTVGQSGSNISMPSGHLFGLADATAAKFIATVMFASSTAPTVTSAGTSPSVTASNGTVAFRINVGTGGTATTIVLALPAATTGWNCLPENITGNAANRANQHVVQQASTTTSATLQNQTISTGAALAFTASDIVAGTCFAF